MAAFILGFSSILTGLNFITTIHRMRAPGMTWFKMPLFVWSLYATAWIQILATPIIGITLLLVCIERWFGVGIFDPTLGGDPVLYQHLFWIYSHPAVYIMILPGLGVVSEILAGFCAAHDLRLQVHCILKSCDCIRRLARVGTSYVHGRHEQHGNVRLLAPHIPCLHTQRNQGLQLDRNALQGIDRTRGAAAFCSLVHCPVLHRWIHRIDPRAPWRSIFT